MKVSLFDLPAIEKELRDHALKALSDSFRAYDQDMAEQLTISRQLLDQISTLDQQDRLTRSDQQRRRQLADDHAVASGSFLDTLYTNRDRLEIVLALLSSECEGDLHIDVARIESVLAARRKRLAGEQHVPQADTPVAKTRGRPPLKLRTVIARMERELATGELTVGGLRRLLGKELELRYDVGRTTAEHARKVVVAERSSGDTQTEGSPVVEFPARKN